VLRLLANENIPRQAVEALRRDGHDVIWIVETARGADDTRIATQARQERRIVLTFDREFAELMLRQRLPRPAGIVLCRVATDSPTAVAHALQTALRQPLPWEHHFAIIGLTDTRLVPLS